MPKLEYYNFSKLDSNDGTYNFLCGARGLGKTYGAKKKGIRNAIKRGEEFIYLRRYKTELKSAKATFFSDIMHEFKGVDFKVDGSRAYYAPISTREDKKRNWITMAHFIALSTAQNEKSVNYDKVTMIIFDEFIIEKGAVTYLPSEHIVLSNFYSTVDRYKDKTKVYFISNAVSIMNPYFLEYKIRPDTDTKDQFIRLFKNPDTGRHFVVAHFPDSEAFKSGVYKTSFGRFIEGTEYADYAVNNTFDDNNEEMLSAKDPKARYLFTLEGREGRYSVWYNMFTNAYYAQAKMPKDETVYTIVSSKMGDGKVLMTFTDLPLQRLRTAFRTDKIKFDNPSTRNSFAEIFKR